MKDEWYSIPGFHDKYKVNKLGQVKNTKTNKILKQSLNRGYLQVCLTDKGKHTLKVHRIMALTFLGKKPNKNVQVNNIDENKLNNSLSNLEYVSPKENSNYGTRNRRMAASLGRSISVLDKNGNHHIFSSIREASKFYSLNQSFLAKLLKRGSHSYHGMFFEYYKEEHV